MTDTYKKDDVGLYNLDKNTSTGAGFFDAAISLNTAVKEGDQVAIGIGSAGMALETLGLVLDPIGSLLTAGIGWIIEHVSIFRWPLDMMYGHPEMIAAAKEAIDAEKAKLEQWSTAHQEALGKLMGEWSGDAADAFKKNMEAVTAQLASLGGYVEVAGKQMQIAGGIVGAFRGIVRDLIAMVLATIIKGALIAAALAPITFGASIVFFVGTTIAGVAVTIAKIAAKIAQLTAKLGKLLASLGKMGKAGDDLAGAAPGGGAKPPGGGAGGGGKPPPAAAPPPPTRPPPDPPADATPPAAAPPKTDDPATPPKTDEPKPKPNPYDWEKGKPLGDQVTQVIKDRLSKVDGVTPEILKKFDHISNMSVDQLKKIMPAPWAEKFEGAIKVMTDPWYGKSGLAGKTVVDLIKGVPASINNSSGGDDK